jgi:hypothetical protein
MAQGPGADVLWGIGMRMAPGLLWVTSTGWASAQWITRLYWPNDSQRLGYGLRSTIGSEGDLGFDPGLAAKELRLNTGLSRDGWQ